MSVTDYLPTRGSTNGKVDGALKKKIERGRTEMMRQHPKRRLCFKFWRGDQWCWVDEKNVLRFQDTVTHVNGGGKPPHRVRTTRNFIKGLVEDKVSNATNRTPGYDISPGNVDQASQSAASLSQKVAFYGYDKWSVRKARVKAVTNALVADGGFAMPYFDPNVGPFYRDVDGRLIGQGEVKIWVGHGNQVAWEPGMDFDDSPWHAIFRARPIYEVEKFPGFTGGKLRADATTSDVPTDRPTDEMVLVTDYFERPCPDYPDGRKLTIANDREILPEEKYPCVDPHGNVVDEPVLHQITYTVDPDADRDMGLVEHLIEPQRVLNDCASKISEWKNRTLNPQMIAPVGSLKKPRDDLPGATWFYNPVNGQKPEWEKPPPIPAELFNLMESCKNDMKEIAADVDVSAAANVAARTVQQVLEKSGNRWGSFLSDLAEFDSRLMRHCLYLVARHYSEPRLLDFKGKFGWENVRDFQGADLRGQCNVRVLPDSLVNKTRQGIRDEIQFWITNFPGAIPIESAMAAWNGGLSENLILGYELDVAKVNRLIQTICSGEDLAMAMPPRFDKDVVNPVTGQPGTEVPGWMPRKQDNVNVWKTVIGDFMKTVTFERLAPPQQEMFNLVWDAIQQNEEQEKLRQAALQTQLAEQQGMANAAAPQAKALPSQPATDGSSGP